MIHFRTDWKIFWTDLNFLRLNLKFFWTILKLIIRESKAANQILGRLLGWLGPTDSKPILWKNTLPNHFYKNGKKTQKSQDSAFLRNRRFRNTFTLKKNKGNKVDRDFVEKRSFTSEVIYNSLIKCITENKETAKNSKGFYQETSIWSRV